MNSFKKLASSSSLLALDGLLRRLAGLISTLILARILLPEDFGLVTLSLLVIGFSQAISEVGTLNYLQSRKDIDADDINTAFSIEVAIKTLVYLVIASLSIPIAWLFEEPLVTSTLVALCVVSWIDTLKNPALVLLKRKNQYTKIVIMSITVKLLRVVVTVIAALLLKTHWALVIGLFLSHIFLVLGSYIIYPYLPKLTLCKFLLQIAFSGWSSLQSILGYIRSQMDVAMAGVIGGMAGLGAYNNVKFLASMPVINIITPMVHPVINNFRDYKNNLSELSLRVDSVIIFMCIVIAPFLYACIHFDYEIIHILYGQNWVDYSIFLSIFSLLFIPQIITMVISSTLFMFDRVKLIFYVDLLMLIGISSIAIFSNNLSLQTFAYWAVGIEATIKTCVFLWIYQRYIGSIKRIVTFLILYGLSFIGLTFASADLAFSIGEFGNLIGGMTLFCAVWLVLLLLLHQATRSTDVNQYIWKSIHKLR